MKKALFAVLVLALSGLAFLPGPAAAQRAAPTQGWESLGPSGGDIADLVAAPGNPSRLYAVIKSVPTRLFTSADSGQSWTKLAEFQDTVFSLAIDPSNPSVMHILGEYSIQKSTDGGASWHGYYYFGHSGNGTGGEIAVHPLDPSLVMATCRHAYEAPTPVQVQGTAPSWKLCIAFYRSQDAGATWSEVFINAHVFDGGGLSLAVDPSHVNEAYIGGYEADEFGNIAGKVYKTVNGGWTWTDVPGPYAPFRVETVVLDPHNPATVLVGTPWYVFRSTDGGLSWGQNQGQAFAHEILLDPLNSNTLYAGWDQAVYKSLDGGVNWTILPGALAGSCQCLLASGSDVFYGSDEGLFRSADAGASWQASQAGLNASMIRSFAVSPAAPETIYAAVGPTVYRSSHFGETWDEPPYTFSEGTLKQIVASPSDPDVLYALVQGCGSG